MSRLWIGTIWGAALSLPLWATLVWIGARCV